MMWGKLDKDKKKSGVWYPWYAWHPVEVEDGRLVWLQRIERKQVCYRSLRPGNGVYSCYRLLPVKESVLNA